MSAMGVKIDNFDVPVCNSFKAKIRNDQLCYEVDLDQYKDKDNIDKSLKLGLLLFMDYNEDRQVILLDENLKNTADDTLTESMDSWGKLDNGLANIYLNTIGKPKYM